MSNPKILLTQPLPHPAEDLTGRVLFDREPAKPEPKMYTMRIRALVITEFINSLFFLAVLKKYYFDCFQIIIT